jgi:glycosyltransferase involved in cell wall biosynthesis
MKITLLSTCYPYRGGIAQFNASMYRALEEAHQVNAVTFTRQYPNLLFPGETQFVTENDPSDKIPAKRLLDTINPFSYFKTARYIKKQQPDILLMKYWMTFFAPALGTVAKLQRKNTKRICVLDNLIPHEKRFFDRWCNRYFLKHTDGYIVMSNSVLADLLSMKPAAKYLRIDHPLYNHFGEKLSKEAAANALQLDPSRKYILFFGFIRDYKGLDLLIDAMKTVDESLHLIVAGEVYGSFDKYTEQINAAGLANRIHVFNHYIGDADVPPFFSLADVCVLPYKSATQSGITSIAYHFELPIIATDVGGLKESIIHEKNGLIVPNPVANEISAAIDNYFSNDLKLVFSREIMAYKEAHSWENFTNKIIDFSKSL